MPRCGTIEKVFLFIQGKIVRRLKGSLALDF